jgi:hypothetical protein
MSYLTLHRKLLSFIYQPRWQFPCPRENGNELFRMRRMKGNAQNDKEVITKIQPSYGAVRLRKQQNTAIKTQRTRTSGT